MIHPNAETIKRLYSHFTQGDIKAMLALCSDNFSFQIAGKSKIAGKFTKANFAEKFASALKELSGGTYSLEVHDVLASDLHATVLGTVKVTTHGKASEFRTVHVWRFENGKPLAGYEYPRDLYQYDQIWS